MKKIITLLLLMIILFSGFKVFSERIPRSSAERLASELKIKSYSTLISTIHGLNPSGGFIKTIQFNHHGKIVKISRSFAAGIFNVSAKEDLYSKFGATQLKIEPLAPAFTLKNLDGKKINLQDYKGKVILLNFWATWCEPCLEEMPAMQKAYNMLKDKGFVVLAVSIDEASREKHVRAFAKKLGLSYPILLDSDQKVRDKYFNNVLPTSYLINAKGRLKGFISGARDWGSDDAVALINNLLQNTD